MSAMLLWAVLRNFSGFELDSSLSYAKLIILLVGLVVVDW
jgi:hypothetical protein